MIPSSTANHTNRAERCQKRGGSGTTAFFIQRRKRGATFRTGFYWIVLDWKKIRSETSLKKSNPKFREEGKQEDEEAEQRCFK
jgi:hypothetical protein